MRALHAINMPIETKMCYVVEIRILVVVHEPRILQETLIRIAEHFSRECFGFIY